LSRRLGDRAKTVAVKAVNITRVAAQGTPSMSPSAAVGGHIGKQNLHFP
jgi:hypothetical protein